MRLNEVKYAIRIIFTLGKPLSVPHLAKYNEPNENEVQ